MNNHPSLNEMLNFVEYLMDFYGIGEGMYARDLSNGVGYTWDELYNAAEEYVSTSTLWGGGDTFDRENVIRILDPRYGSKLI